MDDPKIEVITAPRYKKSFKGKLSKKAIEAESRTAEVMILLSEGMSQQSVATELGISRQAVSSHMKKGLIALRESTVKSRKDMAVLETEKLEMLREAHFPIALEGDVKSAMVVLKISERIASLWGLYDPKLLFQDEAKELEQEQKETPMMEVIKNHLDYRAIDTENGLWAEISPHVRGHLEGKSLREYAEYVASLAIPIIPEVIVPIRKSLPGITGSGDFKGVFEQTGNGFLPVDLIEEHRAVDIIDCAVAIKKEMEQVKD